MNKNLMNQNKGFTLIELMVAMAIFSIIMGFAVTAFTDFAKKTPKIKKFSRVNSDSKIALLLMEKDIKSAGFGMPSLLRIAIDDTCAGPDTFCITNSDRIFIADGWEIIKDFTDNGEVDGAISTANYVNIANTKASAAGGYFAQLTANVASGNTALPVNTIDIDSVDTPTTTDDDFKANRALIIYDNNPNPDILEGHRIDSIPINLLTNDGLNNNVLAATAQIVPAIVYYIAEVGGVNWLFRNNNKVLQGVSSLQFKYGYDNDASDYVENAEWIDTIPAAPDPSLLKAVKISMTVDAEDQGKTYQFNFSSISDLRN